MDSSYASVDIVKVRSDEKWMWSADLEAPYMRLTFTSGHNIMHGIIARSSIVRCIQKVVTDIKFIELLSQILTTIPD
jgi:hypothetical protein